MFKGLGQLGDMAKIMKQAQEMQSKMTDAQSRLDSIEVLGESGAGLVKVIATAKGQVTSIDVDESILQPSEKEVIEDLIVAAINDAQSRAKSREKEEMASITEGLGLPPGMKLPF
jgi:hypothetical protein